MSYVNQFGTLSGRFIIVQILICAMFMSLSSASAADPVVIRNADFKEGMTFDKALAQVYKKIVPKKSTKVVSPCFWMLGDGQYLMVYTPLKSHLEEKPLDIEPLRLEILAKVEKKGVEFLVNGDERLTLKGLEESIVTYVNVAMVSGAEPRVQICPSSVGAKEGITILKLIHKMGVKKIYLTTPVTPKLETPVIPLPKKLPISPHKK